MEHKQVVSQLDRHALLLALAKQVTEHVERNPIQENENYEVEPISLSPITHYSSK